MTKKLTPNEKRRYHEMVDLFGGENVMDKAKLKRRILSQRNRKTGRVTARDMEDMLGY